MIGTVTQVWRYPVKSMQGSRVASLDIATGGAPDDRRWAVTDPDAGRVLSAKRWPALLEATASIDDSGRVLVTLPDGSSHVAGDDGTDAALSGWLGREVRLAQPPADAPMPFVMGVNPTDDASDDFEWAGPAGTWLDLADVHLLTTTSLARAAAEHPDGVWDVRRFRPTAVIDMAAGATDDEWPEDAWVGRQVQVGSLVVEGVIRCMRCAMPTRAQPGLPRDLKISETLQAVHGNDLGLYANVATAGRIAENDPVSLV